MVEAPNSLTLAIICIGLPAFSVAAFIIWLIRRDHTPRWLLAAALVPSLVLLPFIAWWTTAGDMLLIGLLLAVLPLVSIIALLAALSQSRPRSGRWAALGLAAPLPVMALLVFAYAYTLNADPFLDFHL